MDPFYGPNMPVRSPVFPARVAGAAKNVVEAEYIFILASRRLGGTAGDM